MPKGFFTQAVVVLMEREISLDEVAALLAEFSPKRAEGAESDKADETHFGGAKLIVPYRPEVNGNCIADVRGGAWPDSMGDPKADPHLFVAWTMGHFGPGAFPGGLQRAAEHWWAEPEKRGMAPAHGAYVRLRMTYVMGAGPKSRVAPEDYAALPELEFLNRMVVALLKHPAAVAYFNPSGEVLATAKAFARSVAFHGSHQLPPLGLWTNIRIFNVEGWTMMDTVGMEQLDRRDSEVCFPTGKFEAGAVDYFMRNCCLYLLQKGEVINDGDTMNGPGEKNWQARHREEPVAQPPRRTLRWFEVGETAPIPNTLWPEEPEKRKGGFLKKLFGRK